MQIILVGAAVVNQVVTGESGTTIVLVGLTVFNAVLGLRQESKAEASLAALEKMLKDIARVRRDGAAIEIDAAELVPGDVVLFEAGNRVPADGRLIVAATLEIEEAALTGESAPVLKDVAPIEGDDVGLGDRICLAFMNTSVTRGRGEMIVTGTGMSTEIGNIATLLNQTEADKTPLQKQLDHLTQIIVGVAGIAFLTMLLLGIRDDRDFDEVFLAGVALAISAIPTGLPAVVTTLYSMGTRVLAEHNAIVKRLAIGRDPRLGVGHLLGQDRHPDPEQDDRSGAGGARPQPVHDQRRGLRHHGGDQARRWPHVRPRRRAPADGAVRGRPARRCRRPDRRPDRGGADRAGRQGRDRPRRLLERATPGWRRCRSTPSTSSWRPSTA